MGSDAIRLLYQFYWIMLLIQLPGECFTPTLRRISTLAAYRARLSPFIAQGCKILLALLVVRVAALFSTPTPADEDGQSLIYEETISVN